MPFPFIASCAISMVIMQGPGSGAGEGAPAERTPVPGIDIDRGRAWLAELTARTQGMAGVLLPTAVSGDWRGLSVLWPDLEAVCGARSGIRDVRGADKDRRSDLYQQGQAILAELHRRGVVHGGLSPATVGFDNQGQVVLSHVGLADLISHGGIAQRTPSEWAEATARDRADLDACLGDQGVRRPHRRWAARAGVAAFLGALVLVGLAVALARHPGDRARATSRQLPARPCPTYVAFAPAGLVVMSGAKSCGETAVWTQHRLATVAPDGRQAAFAPVSNADDVVLGDWSCDGRLLPGLLSADGVLTELYRWPVGGGAPTGRRLQLERVGPLWRLPDAPCRG
jgi:hypothetical protein